MRLRFGRVSLPMLIFMAVIVVTGFYIVDNWERAAPVNSPTLAPTQAPPTVLVQNTPLLDPTATPVINAPRRQEIPTGSTLFIPAAGIFSTVVQAYLDGTSWDISQLRSNAGHLEGTAWVNQPGNVVISGHVELSNGQPGIFADLTDLEVGDIITLQSDGTEYVYVVIEVYSTRPDDLRPIMPTQIDRLTLITCDSYDFISNTYQDRVIIVAERVS